MAKKRASATGVLRIGRIGKYIALARDGIWVGADISQPKMKRSLSFSGGLNLNAAMPDIEKYTTVDSVTFSAITPGAEWRMNEAGYEDRRAGNYR